MECKQRQKSPWGAPFMVKVTCMHSLAAVANQYFASSKYYGFGSLQFERQTEIEGSKVAWSGDVNKGRASLIEWRDESLTYLRFQEGKYEVSAWCLASLNRLGHEGRAHSKEKPGNFAKSQIQQRQARLPNTRLPETQRWGSNLIGS